MAQGLWQSGEQVEAADQFVRAATLAVPDGDELTIETALFGLGMLNRLPAGHIPAGLPDLPAALAGAGMRQLEARCRVLLAKLM